MRLSLRIRTTRAAIVVVGLASGLAAMSSACGGGDSSSGGGDGTTTQPPPGVVGPSSTFDVGPNGGTFAKGGVVITVPAGALGSNVSITVAADTTTPSGYTVDGTVYRFGPSGLTFAIPISITLPAMKANEMIFWTREGDESHYDPLWTTHDAAGLGASAQVTHFSAGFVGSSVGSVSCVTHIPKDDCSFTTLVEAPTFRFTTFAGAPSGDSRIALATDSVGLNALYAPFLEGDALLFANAGHSIYAGERGAATWGSAAVSGNTLTSLSINGSRDTITGKCQPIPKTEVQCTGGNVTIANETPASGGDAGADGGADGSVDAGDDAGADGGMDAGEGGDAAACIGPATVDPYSYADAPIVSFPQGSFGCPLGAPFGQMPTARVIEFTKPVNFTMWETHALTLQSAASASQIRPGCDGTMPATATHASYDCRTSTTVLAPGVYTFVACDTLGRFLADPVPVAINTNTSCATASTTLVSQARVYDGTKLYFTRTQNKDSNVIDSTDVAPPTIASGRYRMVVQTTCDDPTTNVLDTGPAGGPFANGPGNLCSPAGTDAHSVALTAGMTYWIVLSEIDPGLQLSLSVP